MIPLVDLGAQYRQIHGEIDAAIGAVVESGAFVLGEAVERFEVDFAEYCGRRHAIGVNSGTSALHLSLAALGIGAEDEVIAPAMTFMGTVAPILYVGARPVLVDVDPTTYTIDIDLLETAITSRTRAIIPVHLYGQMADMDPILELATKHRLEVIEDAAQAHGALYEDRKAGSLGRLGCFSFYPGKNLGAYGEGGAVLTDDDDLARQIRKLRNWAQGAKFSHDSIGFNYRMDGIQGAVLGVKLGYLDSWTRQRREVARLYKSRLQSNVEVLVPVERKRCCHVFHVFAVQVPQRDQVLAQLRDQEVQAQVHYPLPMHLQPCLSMLGHTEEDFPVAARLARNQLSLPIFPEMSVDQTTRVVTELERSLRSQGNR